MDTNRRYKSKLFWLINFPVAVGLLGVFFCLFYLIMGLKPFEYSYSLELLGISGLLIFALFAASACHIFYLLVRPTDYSFAKVFKKHFGYFVPTLLLFIWMADWVFLEKPFSKSERYQEEPTFANVNEDDLTSFSLFENASRDSKEKVRIMYARIQANRHNNYLPEGFAATIDEMSGKYEVSSELIFYWLYMGSFWGEAASAKVPFFRDMTAETFRDYIQIHLPSWFIESDLRVYLIESRLLEQVFGKNFGKKLRYALQKSNYDISAEPYDVYIYTDIYVVLKRYKEQFPEIFIHNSDDELSLAISNSMAGLDSNFEFSPCSPIYEDAQFSQEFYKQNRENLIIFARAVFYKLMSDTDFATKIQVLVAKKIESNYRETLGNDYWESLFVDQQLALTAMLRDVYTPNIGKVSHNLYNLPEFNCAPQSFVIKSIKSGELPISSQTVWRPDNYEYLWAGATKKLQILSEVLEVTRGRPLAGIKPSNTIEKEAKNLSD